MLEVIFLSLIKAIWILIPAGTANIFPPLAKGKRPIDFGLKIGGIRILGDGKTWEGTIFGYVAGVIIGLLLLYLQPFLNTIFNPQGIFLPQFTLLIVLIIPLAGLLGDMLGSVIKRRMKMERGAEAPMLDQLDFIFGVILFTYTLIEYTMTMILLLVILTYFVHRLASFIAFKIKIKKEPW
ncbi:MAG: CDP-2,3-bis-(O-geranylgeranyl)-sn-glycerol synthase [Nanoarchaeota archaeon]|nr:CDP-2,3-bis-(O-geranylgeranyl)-sn-glycerol synthase [Nanoarchaeota archaeon]